jgi:hypothetical protein
VKGSIQEVDAQRARWSGRRHHQNLTHEAGEDFALGGLGRHVYELDLRLLFLPGDPDADVVPLDDETMQWLKETRDAPYGGQSPRWWNHRERVTSSALIRYEQPREDRGWRRYLALHRHGGFEIGSGSLSREVQGGRIFMLRTIVAMAWVAAALQAEAVGRWPIQAPFELTIGLRNTGKATLGNTAEGWAPPEGGFLDELPTCLDDQVLLRHEVDDTINPKAFALSMGDHLEQAFGSTRRRHIARVGQYEGRFDPRF